MRASVEADKEPRHEDSSSLIRPPGAVQMATPQSAHVASVAAALNQGSAVLAQSALQARLNQRPVVQAQIALQRSMSPLAPIGAATAPPIAPVVQRALNEEDAGLLAQWLETQDIKSKDAKYDNVVQQSNSLAGAKAAALENASRSISGAKATLLGSQLERFGKKLPVDQVQAMRDVLDVLGAAQQGQLGGAVTNSIASLAGELMDAYPPDKNTYVFIGNSPALLLAWLQLNGLGEAAFHLPLGGLTTEAGDKKMRAVGKEGVQAKVDAYLDGALGPAVGRGLPLVLVDYVSTGGSLVATANFVKAWLQKRDIDLSVHVFGYSETPADDPALEGLMQSGHEGILATSTGRSEKAFTDLNKRKLLKNALLLKGPASVDIVDLLNAENPVAAVVQHPEHWARLQQMMQQALGL